MMQLHYNLAAAYGMMAGGPGNRKPGTRDPEESRKFADLAVEHLEKAYANGFRDGQRVARDMAFDGIRNHPGLKNFQVKLNKGENDAPPHHVANT